MGTPDVHDAILAQVRRQHAAEVERREAEARDWLTARVRDKIKAAWLADEYIGQDWGDKHPWSPSDWNPIADAAVDVFVDFLRNPPVREIHPGGVQVVRWPGGDEDVIARFPDQEDGAS